jgi:hypothetical protein
MPFAEVVTPVADAEPGVSPAVPPGVDPPGDEPFAAEPSTSTEDEGFYEKLAEILEFRDVVDPERHVPVPPSSLVVLVSVSGSARAIESGRYKDVNALAVAAIIGLCNAVPDLQLPYIFRGEAATALIPASRREVAVRALRGVRALAKSVFGLDLRAGIVPMSELLEAGFVARLARFRASARAQLAMFSGSAFSAAERWLDDPVRAPRYELSAEGESHVNLDGFECRWQPLVSQRGHTVSLIVCARAPTEAERTQTYKNLIRAFERIVDGDACHPVKVPELKLQGWFGDYSVEARIRAQVAGGPAYGAAFKKARQQTCVGKLLGSVGLSAGGFEGKKYKSELVDSCDYRKFDDTLRMILDLNVAEIYRLESRLSAEHRAGRLVYGLHRSPAAIVTCFVRSYKGDHLHFVDGSDGGYALASRELEGQLRELASPAANGQSRKK